ncbi:flavodoxin [Pseudoalteromonas fenneropenaei]|uniref:Flavodoxin n=1 Tax=Pseudoalteromonas fenneropenaei TaxID=1737459 RepID=A0ABV7CGD9_9GAMM
MANIAIFVGSMYGNAENLADTVAKQLINQGHGVNVHMDGTIEQVKQAETLLFISSTTGQGDLPDNIYPLFLQLQSQFPMLTGKKAGVIALGDSSYGDTFCGAGRQIDGLLQELAATQVMPRLDVDACEYFEPWEAVEAWLQDWQAQL